MLKEDHKLFSEIKEGSKDAFKEVYDLYFKELYSIAEYYVKNNNYAEDIIQEVFILLWNKKSEINLKSSLRSYLISMVRNQCIDYLRKIGSEEEKQNNYQKKLKEINLLETSAERSIGIIYRNEIKDKFEKSIKKLPKKCRHVFELSRLKGMKNIDIAEKTGTTVKAVERNITRGLTILRNELKDYF